MDFESTLFNPFKNRLEIPLYHMFWISFLGKCMGYASMFANYYLNIDNLYQENIKYVQKHQIVKLRSLNFDSSRYINAMSDELKSISQLPDAVVDIIVTYVSSMMEIDDDTEESKKQISLMLFKYEWYKQHGIRTKRIWQFIYELIYIWFICRALLWMASFIILMYEYHLMRSDYSSWDKYVLFLWILGYFHPNMLHDYSMTAVISVFADDDDDEDEETNHVIAEDGSLHSRSFESLKMMPKVWLMAHMVSAFCFGLWTLTAEFVFVIPAFIIYAPFFLGYGGLLFVIIWGMEKLEKAAEQNSICKIMYRILITFVILLALPMIYWSFVWFNIVSTASMYCFFKNGKWWECFVDSFSVQNVLVLPQFHDWKMIVVLLAMVF
eukprot:61591_1